MWIVVVENGDRAETSRNMCVSCHVVTSQFGRNFPDNFDHVQHTEIVIYAPNTITQLPEIISVMMSHIRTRQDTLIAELSLVVNDFLAHDILVAIQRRYNYLLLRVGIASIVSSDFTNKVIREIVHCKIFKFQSK